MKPTHANPRGDHHHADVPAGEGFVAGVGSRAVAEQQGRLPPAFLAGHDVRIPNDHVNRPKKSPSNRRQSPMTRRQFRKAGGCLPYKTGGRGCGPVCPGYSSSVGSPACSSRWWTSSTHGPRWSYFRYSFQCSMASGGRCMSRRVSALCRWVSANSGRMASASS